MRPAFSASKLPPSSRDKGRKKGAAEHLLTDHVLSLRARLRDALALGLAKADGHGGAKQWQSTDAGVQSHALKAMAAFIGCLSSEMLKCPPIKESIPDTIVALEGLLKTKNVSVLTQAADISFKLVSSLGYSFRQYPIMELVSSLSCQLSSVHIPIVMSCASALNCILNSLTMAKASEQKEVWEILEKTNAVASIVSALRKYNHNVHPFSYLTELISLLEVILRIWPSSRCSVWSNCNLIDKLAQYCNSTDTAVATKILKLYASLGLCAHGAVTLLMNEDLMTKISDCLGKYHPIPTKIEAFKVCQVLLRSSKGCNLLMTSHCQPIVQGIIDAMSDSDNKSFVREGCRTALLALRYPGNHHRCFWTNGIDEVLCKIVAGRRVSSYQAYQILCCEELPSIDSKDVMNMHPFVWDILGYLAVHCNNEYLSARKQQNCFLQALISCACLLARDFTHKTNRIKMYKDDQEPILRAVLMMLLSPSHYIFSEASSKFMEVAVLLGGDYLNVRLHYYGSANIMTDLMNLACLVIVQSNIITDKSSVLDVLSTIIKQCLHNTLYISRSSFASHLQFCFEGSSCCYLDEEWEGENIILFYALVVLYNLLRSVSSICVRCKRNLDMGIVCYDCRKYYAEGLIRILEHASCLNLGPGPKSYIAHTLSLFGLCGFPSKLGGNMRSALCDNELVDLELSLAGGESLNAHEAILSARCPKLLPSKKSLADDGRLIDKMARNRVRMSDRIDSNALKKILEYTYTGFVTLDDDCVKPVRILAKYCDLKSLQWMLQKEQPRWNSDCPRFDLTAALEPAGLSFSDVILEAQSNEEMECHHLSCQLSTPHIHVHKIILSASCDYLGALFRSGMRESFADVIKVPVGWEALNKLVHWFYSGKLPRIPTDCLWKNMSTVEQLSHLRSYAELSSLAEFWFLEGVKEESLEAVTSCLNSSNKASVEFSSFAANLGQWELVKAAISSVAHLYPKLRYSGQLGPLDEEVHDMLRTEYVRYSQQTVEAT